MLVSDCLHYYKTPALDNQFSNFEITSSIPSDGTYGCKYANSSYCLLIWLHTSENANNYAYSDLNQ